MSTAAILSQAHDRSATEVVTALYRALLTSWNTRQAMRFALTAELQEQWVLEK